MKTMMKLPLSLLSAHFFIMWLQPSLHNHAAHQKTSIQWIYMNSIINSATRFCILALACPADTAVALYLRPLPSVGLLDPVFLFFCYQEVSKVEFAVVLLCCCFVTFIFSVNLFCSFRAAVRSCCRGKGKPDLGYPFCFSVFRSVCGQETELLVKLRCIWVLQFSC